MNRIGFDKDTIFYREITEIQDRYAEKRRVKDSNTTFQHCKENFKRKLKQSNKNKKL